MRERWDVISKTAGPPVVCDKTGALIISCFVYNDSALISSGASWAS